MNSRNCTTATTNQTNAAAGRNSLRSHGTLSLYELLKTVRDSEQNELEIGADVYLPHSSKKRQTIGDYKLIRQLGVRGYDEEWLVQSVTGAFMLAELIRRSRFDTSDPYERAFESLKLYKPISLSHQNLEPILHAGISGTGDYLYYVTELADDLNGTKKLRPGKYHPVTLDSIIAHSGRWSIPDCINLALDVVGGLGYLHDQGLVHRNIKPSRIHFFRRIAKISGIWLVAKTGAAESAGTQGYIPPEGHGMPGGDLYSLGKTLEKMTESERTVALARTDLPGQNMLTNNWQTFLTKLCHPNPLLRYQSAAEVRLDLSEMRASFQPNRESEFYSCFISYSHRDKAFAVRLFEALRSRKVQCWLDEHQLLPGDDLHERIDQGVRLWDKVLLCASRDSLTSWWVDGEINRAFQKEAEIMKERGKKVLGLIPLNLDGFLFSADYESGKKSEIKGRVAANFVGWANDCNHFDVELEKVIRALRTNEGGREAPPSPQL